MVAKAPFVLKIKIDMKYLYALAVIFLLGCEKGDHKFTVVNNLPCSIYYFVSDSDENYAARVFSAITPQANNDTTAITRLSPNDSSQEDVFGSWDNFLDYGFSNGTAVVYWIDSADAGKRVRAIKKQKLVRKIEISTAYMKQHNWRLVFR